MTAPLEGLSSASRLMAERAAGPVMANWGHCPECPDLGPISPVACTHRAVEFLLTGRARRHLCLGETCPGWQSWFPERARQERAKRPTCARCGEPMEGGDRARFCSDCRSVRSRERMAAERMARNAAAVAGKEAIQTAAHRRSTPIQSGVTEVAEAKEGPMKQAAAPPTQEERLALLAERYPNHPPLPEGAHVSVVGRLRLGSNEKKPCPKCQRTWISVASLGACSQCSGDHMALMRQAKAAKKVVGGFVHPRKIRQAALALLAEKAKAKPPQAAAPQPAPSPALPAGRVLSSSQIEAMAQALAAQIRARAAEILGLEVAP